MCNVNKSSIGVEGASDRCLSKSSPCIWPLVSYSPFLIQEATPTRTGSQKNWAQVCTLLLSIFSLPDPVSPSSVSCHPVPHAKPQLQIWLLMGLLDLTFVSPVSYPPPQLSSSWYCFLQGPQLRELSDSQPWVYIKITCGALKIFPMLWAPSKFLFNWSDVEPKGAVFLLLVCLKRKIKIRVDPNLIWLASLKKKKRK